ncbi:MAG: hypothetical protein IJ001_10765 [Oscillospiraceae bacterium]|nr:hypothetical protein [Oscillospiraceae bacterium]
MKKETLMKILLVLLPILAVGLATTTDSVTVYDPAAGTTEYYSYFELLPVGSFQMITPLAAILSAASGLLAGAYAAAKKEGLLKGIVGVSFCSATLAALPIMLSADVKILPNVGLPIFMVIQLFLAYYMLKKPKTEEARRINKLQSRK